MPMPAPPLDDQVLVHRLLRVAHAKSERFADHLDPYWLGEAWRRTGLSQATLQAAPGGRRHGMLLFRSYGLIWPSLDHLGRPAHRICLLGRAAIHRVLSTCALHVRRDSVRLCLTREISSRIEACIGAQAYHRMLDAKPAGTGAVAPLSPGDLDLRRLAAEGCAVLCASGQWTSRPALAITRLALAPQAAAAAAVRVDPAVAADAFEHMSNYFPELTWLFGSDMDRALSGCRTGWSAPAILLR